MNQITTTALIPLLPLAGFVLLGFFGKNIFRNTAGWLSTGLMLLTTAFSLRTASDFFFSSNYGSKAVIILQFDWLKITDTLIIRIGILLDAISAMMLVVVPFISLMVHLYSISYMKGEKRMSTYFSYLGLFTFSMLGLVLSSNLFQIYIFWELVGVSSFLLIGFYFDRPSAVRAAKKAFIVTRFADLGFLIGILLLSYHGQTLDFLSLIDVLTQKGSPQHLTVVGSSFLGITALTWGIVLVFMGGAGKSALFPLHIWLPDAMEGPTPVSALIHAATMVVAGVYLLARLFPVFNMSNPAMDIVTYTGALSAVMAAIIACTQTDIKRVLAYSTMSQIGLMILTMGIGIKNPSGFSASLFHLFTHAFFKSLLFLCAGLIIHYVECNDTGSMGGLRKYLPVTHLAFLTGCIAIAGLPPFAGFFSKEAMIHAAHQSSKWIEAVILCTSFLTSFYMFRLYFLIFWNKPPTLKPEHTSGHSEPIILLVPVILLTLCTAGTGWIHFDEFVYYRSSVNKYIFHWEEAILPISISLTGLLLARWFYLKENEKPQRLAASVQRIYNVVYRKFYIDECWFFLTKKIIFPLLGRPAAWIDRNIIDGFMNGSAALTGWISFQIKGMQSGKIQDYLFYFFSCILALTLWILYRWNLI
jgi:NADH-quinone oxidoreductase subunit L